MIDNFVDPSLSWCHGLQYYVTVVLTLSASAEGSAPAGLLQRCSPWQGLTIAYGPRPALAQPGDSDAARTTGTGYLGEGRDGGRTGE